MADEARSYLRVGKRKSCSRHIKWTKKHYANAQQRTRHRACRADQERPWTQVRRTIRYPVVVHKEKAGGCWLSFPDVLGTYPNGTSVEDAMSHALDALETMFM